MHVVMVSSPPHATRVSLITEREWPYLPGWEKDGILQLAFAGKTSTSVSAPYPPVIIKPLLQSPDRQLVASPFSEKRRMRMETTVPVQGNQDVAVIDFARLAWSSVPAELKGNPM